MFRWDGCLALIVLLQLGGVTLALPNIQGVNVQQQLDKSFFQPPEIEQTIDEVQKILANDPALPRLTRGEIEELYEKVTREEYEKSLEAGDMSRADSMRALMLVLPFNTDNNTEENLQELYTRKPVTRVIDAYTPPDPVKFLTPDPSALPRSTVPGGNPAVAATTYKPAYSIQQNHPLQQQQFRPMPQATTYHPPAPPPVVYQDFKPVTAVAPPPPAAARFSSHYSAKNAQFLRKPKPKSTSSSTVKPVADILESLGIVSGGKSDSSGAAHKRYALDDYYLPAESAPQPSVVAVADLRGLQGARIRPEAYSNFKPLNIGEELRVKPEVEGYLTRFGIVKKAPKALKKEVVKPTEEPTGAHTELSTATARLPSANSNPTGNAELAKLLENLQELERLQLQTKRKSTPTKSSTTRSTTTSTTTPSTTTSSTSTSSTTTTTTPSPLPLITHGEPLLIEAKKPRRRIDPNIDLNFASAGNHQTTASSSDELSKLLQNLQELEKLKINPENVIKAASPSVQELSRGFTTTTSSTTTTTTPSPAQNEARELQRILKQLQQLEQQQTISRKTSTTSTTVKPTRSQGLGLGAADLLQLQRLLSDDRELEKLYEQARNGKKKQQPKVTTSSTSTSTTSTTTTPRPTPSVNHEQFAALITRVQQLEQLQQPSSTTPPNFLTRNVAGSGIFESLPSNDFAHLQELSPTSSSRGGGDLLQVEISTAASTSKQRQRPLSHFERSNGLARQDEVHPQDYVQLQKLLSKVQELERVQLVTQSQSQLPSQLVTAASVRTPNVKTLNGAHIVYAEPAKEQQVDPEPELKLDLPVYQKPQQTASQSSSEELRELAMSQPAHPSASSPDFREFQQFFGSLEDTGERQSYQHMQPIYKQAVTPPAPPRFVPARRMPSTTPPRKADLEELQKLLYNTQQLQKLGVALPHELSQQLESQLQATSTTSSSTTSTTTSTTPAPVQIHDTSSPAVFSLTTSRPREAKPKPQTTESSLQLPVFSATKIIEAAIKRAANRIGVSTELAPKQQGNLLKGLGVGFRRRSDEGDDEMENLHEDEEREGELDGDLMAEFSELNYQLAKPETTLKEKREDQGGSGGKSQLSELQRLISNLQELQQLNVSLDQVATVPPPPVSPDAAYLQSLQNGQDETLKSRRQSEGNGTASTEENKEDTTTQSPTKISLNLGLDDGDTKGAGEEVEDSSSTSSSSTTTTTEESRNGSLDDLADSFGPDPVSEEPPPPKKKNGFYFLADWNSFLEVGDGDDQVVVRLSPKIGDPRLFLPVKIPS
ncbi:AF4/FMR2 family member lilli [Drosophila takahashii]|uniref:AF4/FMR2 family member lilli n=1 Tax=Drosophila takahashii TaxID=29030 RepID=UPI001CF8C414|nr:mucin-5AC [Drosophila takahashii]